MGEIMAKDLRKQFVKAIDEVYQVKVKLFEKDPVLATRLETAIERLNEIAAFYKI